MNSSLKALYERLGYSGPLPGPQAGPADISLESLSVAPLEGSGTTNVVAGTALGKTIQTQDPAELPPLRPEGVDDLEDQLNSDPEGTLAKARAILDKEITEADLRAIIIQAKMALDSPETAVPMIDAELSHMAAAIQLPPDFTFKGMNLEEIPINPGSHKFEKVGDALGWLIHAGPFILTQPSKDDFRWHSHPNFSESKFIYELEEPGQDSPVEIALFSDFGTGLYHSQYIAKQLRTEQFPCAIHLGDVYYAGRRSEFKKHFSSHLDPLLDHTQLFALNANHEMYSGGIPYFESIDKRREDHQGRQRQEGSYFCLRSSKFQIVGIDTAFFGQGRHKEPHLLEWLAKVLDDGRNGGCINILLSSDHPYEYGQTKLSKLLSDDLHLLVHVDKLVDLWFWGNTHYCALFQRTDELPFIGSCLGHAGYPYDRERLGKPSPVPISFLETSARFPKWTEIRQDRGNNGYCVMALNADGSISLRYVDWMSEVRCEATLSRATGVDHMSIVSATLGPS